MAMPWRKGHEFFSIGGSAVSSGQDILAYAVDTQGRRIHTAYLKNLATGEMLPDVLSERDGESRLGQ